MKLLKRIYIAVITVHYLPFCAASSSSSSSKILFIPPESSRNFLCNSRISPNAKKLCDRTDAKNRSACASSPEKEFIVVKNRQV